MQSVTTLKRIITMGFLYDTGFGSEISVYATVAVDGDKASIEELDAYNRDGGNVSFHLLKCAGEAAMERALDMVEARHG